MNVIKAIVAVFLCAGPVAASEAHAPSINQIWFPLVNFLIFLYLLKRFAVPIARDYFRTRRQGIARSINEAAAEKERAEARLQEYKDRWAGLPAEIKKIHEAFVADGDREKARSLEEAQTLALKITSDADFLVGQETMIAQQKVRTEMARLAHAAAERTVRNQLTAEDRKRLIDEFVTGLGGHP